MNTSTDITESSGLSPEQDSASTSSAVVKFEPGVFHDSQETSGIKRAENEREADSQSVLSAKQPAVKPTDDADINMDMFPIYEHENQDGAEALSALLSATSITIPGPLSGGDGDGDGDVLADSIVLPSLRELDAHANGVVLRSVKEIDQVDDQGAETEYEPRDETVGEANGRSSLKELVNTPADGDVICTNSIESRRSPGNLFYQALITKYAGSIKEQVPINSGVVSELDNKEWELLLKEQKTLFSSKIVNIVRARGGRFLFKYKHSAAYWDIGDGNARRKTRRLLQSAIADPGDARDFWQPPAKVRTQSTNKTTVWNRRQTQIAKRQAPPYKYPTHHVSQMNSTDPWMMDHLDSANLAMKRKIHKLQILISDQEPTMLEDAVRVITVPPKPTKEEMEHIRRVNQTNSASDLEACGPYASLHRQSAAGGDRPKPVARKRKSSAKPRRASCETPAHFSRTMSPPPPRYYPSRRPAPNVTPPFYS